jgi:hypothetical protein
MNAVKRQMTPHENRRSEGRKKDKAKARKEAKKEVLCKEKGNTILKKNNERWRNEEWKKYKSRGAKDGRRTRREK